MKPHCPLVRYANQARKASVNILRAMHQLRRSVVVCRNCPLQEKCSQRAAFNAEIDALIADIDEQWQSSEEMCEFQRRFSKSTESGYSKDG